MPELCRFYGIVIRMFWNDHEPPHFHAAYGDHEALVAIESLAFLRGGLPRRAAALVLEWALFRREDLRAAWLRARQGEPLGKIEPLE